MTRIVWQASYVASAARLSRCLRHQADGSPERQREKIIMRIPQQVAERVKEAPAQALRTVFSGIGQVLLVADRIKNRAAEPERAQPAAAASPAQSSPGQRVAEDETRRRSLDETGNVRLLSEEDLPPTKSTETAEPPATEPERAAAEAPAAEAKPPTAKAKAPAAEAKPPTAKAKAPAAKAKAPTAKAKAKAPAAPDQAALPVPNYDDLTLASLRARLRNLDQSQVRMLLDYEKAHAGRPDVLTMFERRVAKLESGEA
jgi:cytoskeletal protein RodZ